MDNELFLGFLNGFNEYNDKSIEYQKLVEEDIIESFKEFWDNKPTEEQFDECMKGIVIFPRIQYYMATKRLDIDNEDA